TDEGKSLVPQARLSDYAQRLRKITLLPSRIQAHNREQSGQVFKPHCTASRRVPRSDQLFGAKGQRPRHSFADCKLRKTHQGILQVWETTLLRYLQGIAKELALTDQTPTRVQPLQQQAMHFTPQAAGVPLDCWPRIAMDQQEAVPTNPNQDTDGLTPRNIK
uniref:Uncharacterized protein n=1 Tax=Romanomermis culicivorax TaxID=13658 RepID=A0A915IYQ0_ROMCU